MSNRRFGDANGASGAVVSARDVVGGTVVDRLWELVDMGALVSVSRSRDGGSVAVTVTWDGEWERKWFRDAADAQLQLDEWAGLIEDLSRTSRPAPAAQQARRKRRS